jgi:hypothetical protein
MGSAESRPDEGRTSRASDEGRTSRASENCVSAFSCCSSLQPGLDDDAALRRGVGDGVDRTKIAKLIRQQQALAAELEWMRKQQEAAAGAPSARQEDSGRESPAFNLPRDRSQSPHVDFITSAPEPGGGAHQMHARPPRSGERRVRRGDTDDDKEQMAQQVRSNDRSFTLGLVPSMLPHMHIRMLSHMHIRIHQQTRRQRQRSRC